MKEKEFRKYPKYKTSGVEWIGEIPEHWEVKKIKTCFESEINGIWGEEAKGDENDKICLRVADFDREFDNLSIKDYTIRNINPQDFEKRNLQFGDLLIEKSGGGELTPVGRVGMFSLKNIDAVCANFMARLRIKDKHSSRFFFYLFKSLYKNRINIKSIKQTTGIQNLDTYSYFQELIPLPPLPEQTAIANFLDEKTAKIDSLIEKKKKLIELYKEEKTALINQAVTRGINPNVKLKPSGVDWLGDIPEHWEVKKLKYVAKVNPSKKSYSFQKDSTEEVVFLPMEKVSENGNIFQNIKKQISDVSSGFTYFERDDIIFAKITPCFENGKAALLSNLETDFGFGSTEFHTLRNSGMILKEFLFLIIKSHRFMKIGEAFMSGAAGQKRVPAEFVKDFTTLIPTLFEQQQIVEYIESETKRIDDKIARAEKEIELLQEYRTALISEVVTGKIKV